MATCEFPACNNATPGEATTCSLHATVRIDPRGSWVDDAHLEGGHG